MQQQTTSTRSEQHATQLCRKNTAVLGCWCHNTMHKPTTNPDVDPTGHPTTFQADPAYQPSPTGWITPSHSVKSTLAHSAKLTEQMVRLQDAVQRGMSSRAYCNSALPLETKPTCRTGTAASSSPALPNRPAACPRSDMPTKCSTLQQQEPAQHKHSRSWRVMTLGSCIDAADGSECV
jgi:hypothetical protein